LIGIDIGEAFSGDWWHYRLAEQCTMAKRFSIG